MDERDLIQKLEEAELPQAELPDAKSRLRRELLNAPDFDRRASRSRGFLRTRYALAAVATITIAGFVAVQLMPQRLSAKALIDTMEAAYDSRAVAGAVHYLRQTLSIPGASGAGMAVENVESFYLSFGKQVFKARLLPLQWQGHLRRPRPRWVFGLPGPR